MNAGDRYARAVVEQERARPRGRPAAASRTDVLTAATRRFCAGDRIDVQAIATELGVGRATVYRWFGSRVGLIGEVIVAQLDALVADARARAAGAGAPALLDTFQRINRTLATAAPMRRFLEHERETGLRLLTSSAGPIQPRAVAAIAELIDAEARAGAWTPPIDPRTLAYAIVRLYEAFVYNDAAAGIRGEIERLAEVEAALLGLVPPRSDPKSAAIGEAGPGIDGATREA
jgi:AcrR family transcriptional regulator